MEQKEKQDGRLLDFLSFYLGVNYCVVLRSDKCLQIFFIYLLLIIKLCLFRSRAGSSSSTSGAPKVQRRPSGASDARKTGVKTPTDPKYPPFRN